MRRLERPGLALVPALALFAPVALAACRACDHDHPFVPYHIEAGTSAPSTSVGSAGPPSGASASASASGARDAGPFPREPARVAPPHTTSWTVGKLDLAAPPGATLRQALSWDLDGDGFEDALALAEVVDEAVHEDLFFYRGAASGVGPPQRVNLLRQALDARCTRIERLARVGKRSAAVELGETCPKEVAELGPDRVVALVAWSGSLQTRLALPIVDPPGSQTLALDVDGTDLDGDGLDDMTLHLSLEGGEPPFEPGPPVQATFRWFDRPAGLSRDPGEPERSLHAIASQAASHATRPKEAPGAVALAMAGRFLYQAMCAEWPARRVAPSPEASPLTCEAGHALEELGLAATRGYVAQGDALRAIATLDTAEVPPATHTPPRATEAAAWLASIAPASQATLVRAIGAVPRLGPEAASWGALRFEPSGQVLVRTLAGVVRVDPLHGDETDAAGVLAWGTSVVSPDGKTKLEGVLVPCHGIALEASIVAVEGAAVDGGDATAIPLPVVSPLPKCAPPCRTRCASGLREPVPAIPIAWGPGGLELVAAGEPVVVPAGSAQSSPLFQLLGQPVTPGAPRSPDGATLVVPTSQGILVRGTKTRLLRAKELDHGYGELRDCAVSDDASRVACVRGGVAFVGVWPEP
jgi:hypothetical protein